MIHLIGLIVFGLIVGLIARALMPGRQPMTLLWTVLLGIAGSFIGSWLGQAFGWYGPYDGAGFIGSIVGAIVLLAIYHFATRGRNVASGQISSKEDHFPNKAA